MENCIERMLKNVGFTVNHTTKSITIDVWGINTYVTYELDYDTYDKMSVSEALNMGDILKAQNLLNSVPTGERAGEWNFLVGCVMLRRGYYVDAQRYLDTACNMDPLNEEYRRAADSLRQRSQGFGSGYNTSSGGCTGCDVCQGLICADCCCECMGGDLIRCC